MLTLDGHSELSPDAMLQPCNQQKCVGKMPVNDSTKKAPSNRKPTTSSKSWRNVDTSSVEEVRGLPDIVVPEETSGDTLKCVTERRQKRHNQAVTEMQQELDCIGREMEASILELQEFLQLKVMESDKKSELLLEQIVSDTALEGFSFEGLEELWSMIHQESLNRKKWVRTVDESLKEIERSRATKIADVLNKYTVKLEEISFYLAADVHKLINDEATNINRTLLGNERATAKLLFNLMKSELEKEKSHHLKWQERVKDWKLIQKNCVVQSFREFMASEEIQNPPAVKTEVKNMIKDQIVLSQQRLEVLQHISNLLPPTHTKSEINEWYRTLENLNKSLDTHNVECMKKMRVQYELVQARCQEKVKVCKMSLLDMNVCTAKDAEIVHSDMLQMTEKLEHRFEEELEHMDRDFKEMAEQHEQHCQALYRDFQEAMDLWVVHQLHLPQQADKLQTKVDKYRWEQDTIIQMMKADLDITLEKMKMASCEEELQKYFEEALSSLDQIRIRNETLNQAVMDEVMAYPEAILQELISYSTSISQHFNVKEVFKQNLEGKTVSPVQDENNTSMEQTGLEVTLHKHKAEQDDQLSPPVPEERDSCQQSDGETNPAENEEIQAQETKETEEEEDGESIALKNEETEHAEQEAVFNNCQAERAEIAIEIFSTASGNTYTVLGVQEAGKTENYFTKYEEEGSLPMHLEHVLLQETVFVNLKKKIRLCFFEHLEKWFAECLSNSRVFVAAKKEELNSTLLLHLQLHQQKQREIQTNIYNVRAGELSLHKEHLRCHCAGLGEGLQKEDAEFLKFLDQLNNLNKNFHSRIRNLEYDFLHSPMTEQSASSRNRLQSELHNHLESIGVTVRSYQHHLEEALGKLRGSNVDFLKTCRLFSEGGDFSSEEVKFFNKCLQDESKQIDSLESLIKTEVEKMESSCLKQATELIKESEKKFADASVSRAFMEKVQRSLRQLRQQIKSEVANSNLQSVTLKSYLEKLQQKRDACAHSTADKEALSSEELYDFAKEVLKEFKKRNQYLDCLLKEKVMPHANEDIPTLAMDEALQGSSAPAVETESLRDESKKMVMGLDPEKFPVLNPSRMDTSALDDLAIRFIQNLAGFDPSKKSPDLNQDKHDHSRSAILPSKKKKASKAPAAQVTKKPSLAETKSKNSKKKDSKSVPMDDRYQIFGKKPPESDTFKGIIMNILWAGNDTLLCLGEDFYGEKTPQMGMPEDLPETFEQWAEMLTQKLLSYKRQADDYYNICLREFRDQLKWFEEELSSVSQLAVDGLLKEHLQKLSSSTAQIQHLFNRQLEQWEDVKTVHQRKLHYSLGHPNNSLQLEALCQEEIKRQKDQTDGVHLNTKMLQDCAAECAQSFFSALAALTENLLLELDETITVDDVQVAKTEMPKEKTLIGIRPKQAGLPLKTSEVQQLIKRKRRTWLGIPKTTLPEAPDYILCRGTASVSTAQTTLAHLAVVDAREAAYKKYKCKIEQLFAQIQEESAAQLLAIQRWEDWWEQSIRKIKRLYL